jgi:hypothetical protein
MQDNNKPTEMGLGVTELVGYRGRRKANITSSSLLSCNCVGFASLKSGALTGDEIWFACSPESLFPKQGFRIEPTFTPPQQSAFGILRSNTAESMLTNETTQIYFEPRRLNAQPKSS